MRIISRIMITTKQLKNQKEKTIMYVKKVEEKSECVCVYVYVYSND